MASQATKVAEVTSATGKATDVAGKAEKAVEETGKTAKAETVTAKSSAKAGEETAAVGKGKAHGEEPKETAQSGRKPKSETEQPKLSTGAEKGKAPTPETIREGSVKMEQHPHYEAKIQQAKDAGFGIKVTKGDPYVVVREIVDAKGNLIRVEKELHISPEMRFLDLEHELGHIEQLERFGDKVPPTQRFMERADGVLKKAPQDGILTKGKNAILEYHNRLNEFLRLHERGANLELLKEHMQGLDIWKNEYWRRGLGKGRDISNRQWANEFFSDIPELQRRYAEIVERLGGGKGQ